MTIEEDIKQRVADYANRTGKRVNVVHLDKKTEADIIEFLLHEHRIKVQEIPTFREKYTTMWGIPVQYNSPIFRIS